MTQMFNPKHNVIHAGRTIRECELLHRQPFYIVPNKKVLSSRTLKKTKAITQNLNVRTGFNKI